MQSFIFFHLIVSLWINIFRSYVPSCPVIISNKSALREVNYHDTYFDPDNEIDIKENIKKILFNENYKNEMIKKEYRF